MCIYLHVYSWRSLTMWRDFEGGVIVMSSQKHTATFRRQDFEVWWDFEEIWYVYCSHKNCHFGEIQASEWLVSQLIHVCRSRQKNGSVCFKWFGTAYGCHDHIEGNFLEVQFSWMVDLYYFVGLIFMDASTHAHYILYNWAFFASLIFVVRWSSTKATKIGPLKIFPL